MAITATPAAAAVDDLVPSGVLQFTSSYSVETQSKAIARDSVSHGLEVYALRTPSDQDLVTGTLSREYRETDFFFQYGLTDHWNVSLLLPYVEATQFSNLKSKYPGVDPALDDYVKNLQNQTISGAGNYRLTSWHRPIFSDFHAFSWGYGYWASLESNNGTYTGLSSLQTREPWGGYYAFTHYTYFPRFGHARIDVRFEYQTPLADSMSIPTGGRVSVQGGPTTLTTLDWEHEPGSWIYGLGLHQKTSQPSKIDGEYQEDSVKEYLFHAQLGFGNLRALESAPIRFPYQANVTFDTTIFGFNTPLRDRWGVQFTTYF